VSRSLVNCGLYEPQTAGCMTELIECPVCGEEYPPAACKWECPVCGQEDNPEPLKMRKNGSE
jgi:hypothetical protein